MSGPCFAAEGLPGAFQAPRGLISCERPAHLPRAGYLLVPAEQAVSARPGPLELCLGVAAVEPQQHRAEFPRCFPFLILREKPLEKSCQSQL